MMCWGGGLSAAAGGALRLKLTWEVAAFGKAFEKVPNVCLISSINFLSYF